MRPKIKDEFTRLKISRQRKWQLRKQKAGVCFICGEAKPPDLQMCVKHTVNHRERARKKNKSKRRYYSKSYKY